MLKHKLFVCALILTTAGMALSQQPQVDMARKMEATCTGFCHGPALIAQQRLDRNGWTREVDKMIRWGAAVAPADKDALIIYLARSFGTNRPMPNSFKAVPAGKGSDLYQTYCLACHDDRPMTSRRLDKAGWTGVVDQMIKWGAYVPTARKTELVDYLVTHFGR
jgi:hypothetical protein